MSYKVIYGKNDLVYTGFLALPGKLYQKNELTQDYDTEYKLLHEKHTLSKYFNITPFVVIDKNSQMPVARCMLTYYPEDDVAYFGCFKKSQKGWKNEIVRSCGCFFLDKIQIEN